MTACHLRAAIATTALFMLAACNSATKTSADAAPPMDSLVTVEWLGQHLGEADLVVLDATVTVEQAEDGSFRTVSGQEAFDAGHVPGARFADLTGELADAGSPLKFAVPEAAEFAAAMGRLGVGDDSRVVIYDSSNSAWAARVWWMLRWIGFDHAALLDGGLKAWTAAGRPLSTDTSEPVAGTLTVNLRPDLIVAKKDVHAAIGDDSINIIDSLSETHYRGEVSMYGRPGHIPGASNVSVRNLTDENGRYKPAGELATLFDGDHEGRAITYCGGGIAASSNAFIMTRLGYKDVAVYTASLQEWAADPANPLETE